MRVWTPAGEPTREDLYCDLEEFAKRLKHDGDYSRASLTVQGPRGNHVGFHIVPERRPGSQNLLFLPLASGVLGASGDLCGEASLVEALSRAVAGRRPDCEGFLFPWKAGGVSGGGARRLGSKRARGVAHQDSDAGYTSNQRCARGAQGTGRIGAGR